MTLRPLSRRAALALAGAAALVLAGGALRFVDALGRPLPGGDAFAPWTLWRDPALAGTPTALVAAAILAANPHNAQPWLFRRPGDDAIEVCANFSRRLAAMDPYARELHFGLGCAIENMNSAAGPNGFDVAIDVASGALAAPAESSAPALAARIELTRRPLGAPDPLYDAIPLRRTNRYAYRRDASLPADWLALARAGAPDDGVRVLLFAEGEARRAFDAAVVEATQAFVADAPMIGESDRWLRSSAREIEAHRDGPTLDTAGLSFLALAYAKLFPVSAETSHRAWIDQTRRVQLASAPLVGLIAVRDRYDRRGAIAAGRLWQRLHLAATGFGVALQPINQPIEMIDRERFLDRGDAWARRIEALAGSGWQATFAFRAGLPTRAAPASPRRRLADVLAG
jgi:hypothetical protein